MWPGFFSSRLCIRDERGLISRARRLAERARWGAVGVFLLWGLVVSPTSQADLFSYVEKADEAFRWELREVLERPNGKIWDIHLVSQVWQGITWEHQLQVYDPGEVQFPDLLPLMITGGHAKSDDQARALLVAHRVRTRVAVLYHIPNQPLFDGLKEDALISYTWVKYLETGEEDWILNFPMVKATVRAMDCLEELAQREWHTKIRGFLPFGSSKRGWTTYLTGIVAPERCMGIAPMVFDILNMPVQIQHQHDFWGEYSPMIEDYTSKGLQEVMESGRGFRLAWMVDPYTYRDRLLMPKLILLGSNDPYWPVDAVNFYYAGLPEPKLLLIVPNGGHGLIEAPGGLERVLGSLVSFFRLLAEGKPLPHPRWVWDETAEGATLTVTCDPPPAETRLWVARVPKRDFRPATWEEQPLPAAQNGFQAWVERGVKQYSAAYGELVFPVEDSLQLTVSTQPYVLHPQ